MIFLLGRRYKNDGMIKIGVDMYFKPEENLKKAIEMVNELYLEALRAPWLYKKTN